MICDINVFMVDIIINEFNIIHVPCSKIIVTMFIPTTAQQLDTKYTVI
jgi:hypothetical protein